MSTRKDPDAAYAAFMKMPAAEWLGLILSLASGGVLTPAEQEGFERASKDRRAGERGIGLDRPALDNGLFPCVLVYEPCVKLGGGISRPHGPKQEPHQCPYRAEINGDTSTCMCCEACESECRDDI